VALRSQKDFYSGLMFCILGGAFAIGARNYEIGDAARMGPGYFPLMLGGILVLLGALITLKSFSSPSPDGDPIGAFAWRPLTMVLLANVLFGVLLVGLPSIGLPGMGLFVAIFVLTVVASMARQGFSFKEAALQGAVLAVGSYLVFVVGLNLQFPVWPAFVAP
jgi:hypothetical protein